MSQQPGAPPGWYPVTATGELWWWDGYRWTGHRHLPRAAPEPEAPVPTHTAASWLIAVLPLVMVVIGAAVLVPTVTPWVVLAVFVACGLVLQLAAIGLSFWDVATLRSRGSSIATPHALWILLGGWVYLLIRALLLKGSDRERWVLVGVNVVAGLVTSVMFVVGSLSLVGDDGFRRLFVYHQSAVERTIERGVAGHAGFPVEVDCPDSPPVDAGDSFECTVSNASGRVIGLAKVTWTNNFGRYTWQAHPGTDPFLPQT